MLNLAKGPFYLDQDQIDWVNKAKDTLSLEEKVGQLFCLACVMPDQNALQSMVESFKPGGIMFRPLPKNDVAKLADFIQGISKVPLLIAANLEEGANGISPEFVAFANNMQVGATADTSFAYKQGIVAGIQGASVGCNWSFSPVVDINLNHNNPITNTRSYGDKTELVQSMACQFVKGMEDNGVAATIKHFPGDGVDDRDHHFLTSCNSLTKEEWDESYGEVYRSLIEQDVKAIMAGHITLPAYQSNKLPATLSSELLQDLLRKQLGFNGLVVTDSSMMLGFSVEEREKIVPQAIAAGCDMFLFTRNPEEDYSAMMKGIMNGVITMERLDEAITRILALKASLHLSVPKLIKKSDEDEIMTWHKACVERAVTLVKDTQKLLPISVQKTPRIQIRCLYNGELPCSEKVLESFVEKLRKKGFTVEVFDVMKASIMLMMQSVEDFKSQFDLVIYLSDISPKYNKATLRFGYGSPYRLDLPTMVHEVPMLSVNFGSPYVLYDMPMLKTVVNAYGNQEKTIEAVVEKLLGESEFTGVSPVNAIFD